MIRVTRSTRAPADSDRTGQIECQPHGVYLALPRRLGSVNLRLRFVSRGEQEASSTTGCRFCRCHADLRPSGEHGRRVPADDPTGAARGAHAARQRRLRGALRSKQKHTRCENKRKTDSGGAAKPTRPGARFDVAWRLSLLDAMPALRHTQKHLYAIAGLLLCRGPSCASLLYLEQTRSNSADRDARRQLLRAWRRACRVRSFRAEPLQCNEAAT